MVAQPITMDDFVQNLLRDRQSLRSSLYDNEDLESSLSTLCSEKIMVVSDNARIFSDAVPKAAISRLPSSSCLKTKNTKEETNEQRLDVPKKVQIQTRDRWETSRDSVLTMPERTPMSPYVKTSVFCPKFDMSFLELSQEFSILSLETALNEDDDSDASSSSLSKFLEIESDEFAPDDLKTEGA